MLHWYIVSLRWYRGLILGVSNWMSTSLSSRRLLLWGCLWMTLAGTVSFSNAAAVCLFALRTEISCFIPPKQICQKKFDWRHPDVLTFNIRTIKHFSWNTSCFIVCEATCFVPYMTIIRPSYESSQQMLATCWDPNYVYNSYRYILSSEWMYRIKN